MWFRKEEMQLDRIKNKLDKVRSSEKHYFLLGACPA